MADVQPQLITELTPSAIVCYKCQKALASAKDERLQYTQYSERTLESFSQHSKSISFLNNTRSQNCHLCIQIWEANGPKFRRLLKQEEDKDDARKPGRNMVGVEEQLQSEDFQPTTIRFRWESTERKHDGQRWRHECRRLVFATSDELAPLSYIESIIEIWNLSFTSKEKSKIVFWMTQASSPSPETHYPPFSFNWISDSTASEETHQLANAWITTCLTYHKQCKRSQELRKDGWNPSRVLDVQAENVKSGIRLWEPDAASGQIDYVTLSHSWGKNPHFVNLNVESYKIFKEEIKDEILTRTFRNAVATTRKLGKRYLWIDSLCILQGDAEDWLREASMMGDVYRYGYCNLSAARSGERPGLFMKRNPLATRPLILKVGNGDKTGAPEELYLFHRQFEEWDDLNEAPVNKRAWVFQERIMAPRTLYFGSVQVSYECCATKASEAWPRANLSNDLFDRTLKDQF